MSVSEAGILTFSVDVHQNILSSNVFLKSISFELITHIKVIVYKNSFIISLMKNTDIFRQVKVSSPFITFIPTSFQSFNETQPELVNNSSFEDISVSITYTCDQPNDINKTYLCESTFRLQLANIDAIKRTDVKIANEVKSHSFNVIPGISYKLYCTNCKQVLCDENFIFESVDEYHDSMFEVSENWFCHDHGENKISKPKISLYISDICYFLPHCITNTLGIHQNQQFYKCQSCSSTLSVVPSNYKSSQLVGFFVDKISFSNDQDLCDAVHVPGNNVIKILSNLINNSLKTSLICKLYLESKVSDAETKCLLLWVTPHKVSRFVLHQKIDDLKSEEVLETQEFSNILYCATTPKSSLSVSWKHDFSVDFHKISDSMMENLMTYLISSSNSAPGINSKDNDFKIGYLPSTIS